jgi:hypothetical protein
LLPGVEIYATIDGHGDSPFLHSSPNASLCLAARGVICFITSGVFGEVKLPSFFR